MIYLDNAATTQVDEDVLDAMLPYYKNEYGNAGSMYALGRRAAEGVQCARSQVARLFNCKPENVVFTAGGSEGNNLILKGVAETLAKTQKQHILLSMTEHDSVLNAAEHMSRFNYDVQYIRPSLTHDISGDDVEGLIRDDTGLVGVMYANNETGVVNDIESIGNICDTHSVLFFSDCVQAAGQYPIDVNKFNLDFATVSSHKIHGPKGVGAIFVKDTTLLTPLVDGGSHQEFGLRGGTENVPGIVGFGMACELAVDHMSENMLAITKNKQTFVKALIEALPGDTLADSGVYCNCCPFVEPGKILNLRIDGVSGETLVLMMDSVGVAISAGSACRAHEQEPSRVLLAHGLTPDGARSSIRISFSKYNKEDDLVLAATMLAGCITTLRSISE